MIAEMPERHDQRVDAEDRDADAVDEPDPEADAERDERSRYPSRGLAQPDMMNAAAVAVVATDRSTPPVSITSVCPAARRPSGAA